jgi:glycosyltransferase involved in cell wall biosynthesis
VLFISDHFYPESFLGNEIAEFLSRDECIVDVLTQNPSYPEGVVYPGHTNPLFRITRMGKCRILRIRTVTGYRDSVGRKIANYMLFACSATIFTVLLAWRYDSIFVYHVGALTEAIPLYVAHHLWGTYTSIWSQDIWPEAIFAFGFERTGFALRVLNSFVSAIYRSIDCVMVSSPGFVEKICALTGRRKKPIFIPQWAPKELFASGESPIAFSHSTANFVFAGNIGTQQNLVRVVSAFIRAHSEGLEVALHLVGEGRMLAELKSLVKESKSKAVIFHGRIPQSSVLPVLRKADVCVLPLSPDPSVELTLPAKFQSYLFSGAPILCISRGEARNLIEKHGLGDVADPESVDSILEAIRRMAGYSAEERDAIAQRVRGAADSLFREEILKSRIAGHILGDGSGSEE